MATIDKLDISVYNLYAVRTKLVEQINVQMGLEKAASVAPQLQILNTYAQLSELDLLLGIVPSHTPWAHFYPPKKFRSTRRSPFTFSRVAPSLDATDEHSEAFAGLMAIPCETEEEKEEKEALIDCFKVVAKLNSWLRFIVGRIGQFLQG